MRHCEFCDLHEAYAKKMEAAIAYLRLQEEMLAKAMQYLKEGKAKYYPNTTNSFVDELITDYEKLMGRE